MKVYWVDRLTWSTWSGHVWMDPHEGDRSHTHQNLMARSDQRSFIGFRPYREVR